jgi:hypothetical protein
MQSRQKIIRNRNYWVTAASIVAFLAAIFTLVFLILIWFVWKLPETVGGWEGIKLNPLSLIDVFILLTCAVGVWLQKIWFARLLIMYQIFNIAIHALSFANGNSSLFGIILSLALLGLYIKATICVHDYNRKRVSQ